MIGNAGVGGCDIKDDAMLSLDILLGAAGGLVGGTIASFLELAAFDPYRNPAGAVLGAVFFVLGWDQMLRQR
jgi:hypothetical protein